MMRVKYSEREYLCDYDLSLKFFNAIGIKVNDVTPLRKVFVLSTDEGNKILKKVNYDVERLEFISESLDYVKKSYKNVIGYNKLKNGLNYIKWKNDIYIVMDILDGREASFSNPVESELCSENVALLHNASKGLLTYLNNKYNKNFIDQSFKIKLEQSIKELKYMKNIAMQYEYKNEFDKLFLDNVDMYIEDIEGVKEEIDKSAYDSLRSNPDNITICHNDLAYHNFLIKNTEVNIIDFDYMTLDLRVFDIAEFLHKSIKNAAFDINKMIKILDAYEKVSILTEEEKELMLIILKFPGDFYSITRDYYFKRKKWGYDVYLNRFINKLNGEIFRKEFMEKCKNL